MFFFVKCFMQSASELLQSTNKPASTNRLHRHQQTLSILLSLSCTILLTHLLYGAFHAFLKGFAVVKASGTIFWYCTCCRLYLPLFELQKKSRAVRKDGSEWRHCCKFNTCESHEHTVLMCRANRWPGPHLDAALTPRFIYLENIIIPLLVICQLRQDEGWGYRDG